LTHADVKYSHFVSEDVEPVCCSYEEPNAFTSITESTILILTTSYFKADSIYILKIKYSDDEQQTTNNKQCMRHLHELHYHSA
jgi:hypothetical protein